MPAPKEVLALVERFREQIDAYKSGTYNETQVRREFIDPMFEALGWDVANRMGHAEQYKDVIHEDALKIGVTTKAPDYCFRIGGTRKFFLEAKKPSVFIKGQPEPAYQLRRYAWSAKLPLSILTDFEEFAVYDTRVKPDQSDVASAARILYTTFEEYEERWDEIAGIFARDAVLKGSFDRYVEDNKRKRGTTEVDDAFLEAMEEFRRDLARNIALQNRKLTAEEVTTAVQRTIDRLLFLRICEDRGIEEYGRLEPLKSGKGRYKRLAHLFEEADRKYNSGLFHFRDEKDREDDPDRWTLSLKVDDRVVGSIVDRLYYPRSPYEFSIFPADVLGQVYERFLGKVIRLTAGHQAKVEDKPEVRKAGGVYYTPTYIVEYIVRETVGKLVEGKKPEDVADLAVVDPACGSGSFLLGAYQFLLDWYRERYMDLPTAKRSKVLYERRADDWRLTVAEKKRILLRHIHGVDIDRQAVEVTKLSLLLKVLEGETEETVKTALRYTKARALPDLGRNIQCGNSLIGPDFYEHVDMGSLTDEERARINVFDWNRAFPKIMKRGGFDAVVGNPPYVRVRILKTIVSPEVIDYLKGSFQTAVNVWDLYLLFYERAVKMLTDAGLVGFIVPIQTLHQPNCESLRRLLVEQTSVREVTDFSNMRVFDGPTVKNCVIVAQKGAVGSRNINVRRPVSADDLLKPVEERWPQSEVSKNPGHSLKVELLSNVVRLCHRLREHSTAFGDLYYVTFGLRSCAPGTGGGGKDRLICDRKIGASARPYLEGREVGRYQLNSSGRFIKYLPKQMYSPREPALFEQPKIVSQTMLSKMRLVATLDEVGYYVEQSLLCIVPHGTCTKSIPGRIPPLKFALGCLNSTLQSFFFRTFVIDFSLGGGLVHATPGSQAKLLVPSCDVKAEDEIVSRVQRMLDLHKRFDEVRTEHDKALVRREIEATDGQIDRLVYELYELTDAEIRVVEQAAAR